VAPIAFEKGGGSHRVNNSDQIASTLPTQKPWSGSIFSFPFSGRSS
jgi:hypothetical protein